MAPVSQQWMMGPWQNICDINPFPHDLIYAFGEYIKQQEETKSAFINSYEAARKEFYSKSEAEKKALIETLDKILEKYGERRENS
jgi:hypothetical protein